jgi:prophage regulatory protein
MSRTIIRKRRVRQKTGLSDTTIWRLEKKGEFPARIQITEGGSVGYYEDEIDVWIHERVRGGGKRPPLADRGEAA